MGMITKSVVNDAAFDAAGNSDIPSPASFSIEYDITLPEVASITSLNGYYFSNVPGADPALVEIVFSEAVLDLDPGTLNSGLANCISGTITRVSGTTFRVEIMPIMEGPFDISIPVAAASDYAGNANSRSEPPPLGLFCDAAGPVGSIVIEGDDPTSSFTVDLTLSASDGTGSGVELMYIFNGMVPPPFDWLREARSNPEKARRMPPLFPMK